MPTSPHTRPLRTNTITNRSRKQAHSTTAGLAWGNLSNASMGSRRRVATVSLAPPLLSKGLRQGGTAGGFQHEGILRVMREYSLLNRLPHNRSGEKQNVPGTLRCPRPGVPASPVESRQATSSVRMLQNGHSVFRGVSIGHTSVASIFSFRQRVD
jgi:hypothetical protein